MLLERGTNARPLFRTSPSLRGRAFAVVDVRLRVRRRLFATVFSSRHQAMGARNVSFGTSTSHSMRIDGPRLGKLSCMGRKDITTPDYIALTSRGAVQHLSQDTVRDHTNVRGMYTALEECERSWPKHIFMSDFDG